MMKRTIKNIRTALRRSEPALGAADVADDDDLIPGYGALDRGIIYTAPEIAGSARLYQVTEKSDHWTYERLPLKAGPMVLEGESGRAADGDQAQDWVYNDWPRLRNYIRWANYMATNPPPS